MIWGQARRLRRRRAVPDERIAPTSGRPGRKDGLARRAQGDALDERRLCTRRECERVLFGSRRFSRLVVRIRTFVARFVCRYSRAAFRRRGCTGRGPIALEAAGGRGVSGVVAFARAGRRS
ncbi:MAG: hypothetical protein Q4B35_03315 [Slackia sp.]|nr:hypothetical protein [Slackia sp.]